MHEFLLLQDIFKSFHLIKECKFFKILLLEVFDDIYLDEGHMGVYNGNSMKKFWEKVDDEYKYAVSTINNKSIRMHHFIFEKPSEKNIVVDHINGNGLDNRKCNLRFATYKQNSQNKPKREGTFSKYMGVYKKRNKFRTSLMS